MEFEYSGPADLIPVIIRALRGNCGRAHTIDYRRMIAAQAESMQRKSTDDIGGFLQGIAESLVVERNLAGEINGRGI